MGFIPDVERICKLLPFTRQTLFYSATMPPEIQRLTDQFLHNPVRVEVSRPATTADNIAQELVDIPANDWAKREALRRLIREAEPTSTTPSSSATASATSMSWPNRWPSTASTPRRCMAISTSRCAPRRWTASAPASSRSWCASDVAARGLDIPARQPRLQFRRADPCRRLRPPHRPHRPRRTQRPRLHAGDAARRQICRSHREADRQQAGAPRDDGHRSARRPQARAATTTASGGGNAWRPRPQAPGQVPSRQVPRPCRADGAGAGRRRRAARAVQEAPVVRAPEPAAARAEPRAREEARAAARAASAASSRKSASRNIGRNHDRKNDATPVKPEKHELPAFLFRPVTCPRRPTRKGERVLAAGL